MSNEKHEHTHAQNQFAVIPTAEKLSANRDFTGKNVTIAFLDSGFYPHADFAERIVKFHDIAGEENALNLAKPQSHHWHGTQTVTTCAGNGSLSDGIYRGLASEANLVLIKVSQEGRISDDSIEKGLNWVLENRKKYNIRIVNMSLGGDRDAKLDESKINQLAEELVELGLVLIVAAGNTDESHSIPPANSPSVITVGGYSDENSFNSKNYELYHSNFGKTADGIIKPEIIAPAMFVAAPILPETEDYEAAQILSEIANSPDYSFRELFLENWQKAELPEYILTTDISTARNLVKRELLQRKIVATHYKHVDGTSFAAPITASVIAQMLEANPNLSPAMVKNILVSTASRMASFSALRQGFGVLNANLAVETATNEIHNFNHEIFSTPYFQNKKIVFHYHNDIAETVHLAGDFNNWGSVENRLFKDESGLWQTEIPNLSTGKYRYKLVINGEIWKEDPNNGMKEEDGFGGFNSILLID